jgi:EAL domain-containing protein (putative c-di-GMP-specific phosphodiesterase class I)
MVQAATTTGATLDCAWLEPVREDVVGCARVDLSEASLTVGRVDAAGLTIRSNRISREHAIIERKEEGYVLRDLNSTNGTFVNGVQIQEVILREGDVVVFADEEFTFRSAHPPRGESTVTQVIRTTEVMYDDDAPPRGIQSLVARRLHEAVAHGSARAVASSIHPLAGGNIVGWEIRILGLELLSGWDSDPGGRAAHRLHRLCLLASASAAKRLPQGITIFLPIRPLPGRVHQTRDEIERFHEQLGGQSEIVPQVTHDVLADPARRHACEQICGAAGLRLAVDGFQGGRNDVLDLAEFPPAYLKFERAMFAGMPSGSDRARQLRLIVDACRELGTTVVVKDVATEEEARVCQEVGCSLAQGPRFSPGQTIHKLLGINE